MKAAILVKQNAPLVVAGIEVPKLGDGQVLVSIKASGICGKQINEISGACGPDKYLPHLLGHEGAGIVEAIGPGVTQIQVGDHVVAHWLKGRGLESAPPTYRWGEGLVGGGWVTTFNEASAIATAVFKALIK